MAATNYRPGFAAGITGGTSTNQHLGASYAVSLPLFEGPLDLLLHLIEQEKLDISEISLVAVTDQYLKTIELLEELIPSALADFLVVASRLLYLKSMRLLPKTPSSEDEADDSSENLIRHLMEYRQFRQVALDLRGREDDGNRLFVRAPTVIDLGEAQAKAPEFGEFDVALLQNALKRALARIPEATPLPHLKPYTVTVAERMEGVRARLASLGQGGEPIRSLAFSTLLEEGLSRIEVVVTFLAVLELIKQREIVASQNATFGEIVLVVVDKDLEHSREQGASPTSPVEEDGLAASSEPEERTAEDTGA